MLKGLTPWRLELKTRGLLEKLGENTNDERKRQREANGDYLQATSIRLGLEDPLSMYNTGVKWLPVTKKHAILSHAHVCVKVKTSECPQLTTRVEPTAPRQQTEEVQKIETKKKTSPKTYCSFGQSGSPSSSAKPMQSSSTNLSFCPQMCYSHTLSLWHGSIRGSVAINHQKIEVHNLT